MIRQQMPFTPQYHACLAGKYTQCLYFSLLYCNSNKKVVGVSTISRTEHAVAQTRELECTKKVLPQVIGQGIIITINLV